MNALMIVGLSLMGFAIVWECLCGIAFVITDDENIWYNWGMFGTLFFFLTGVIVLVIGGATV